MAHDQLEPTRDFVMSVDFDKLQSIFLRAAEIGDSSDRQAWVDRACGDDSKLRQRVESLLAAHQSPHPLMNSSLPTADTAATPLIAETHTGTLIAGRYKLLEQIGEGGMGSVWMAEQRIPVRRLVAVKLIKAGMDSRSVLTRFEAERQALAMMDHPSIARVFDGGTTDRGHPWFAMELVRGLPVTKYCDERRLSVSGRLELFMQICSAVQHAHQKGIIHRDLKPSNVLVTEHDGRPVPKVIDFGLAKALGGGAALTEHTLFTSFGAAAGTPLYMAPEQVAINALDIDTRADVYALGVLLYELLTGTTPLERLRVKDAAWDEIRRVIREEEPPRPSLRISTSDSLPTLAATRQIEPARLSGLLRGDLDWIVLKALEKDRNRRYESAAGLAADIGRHLADEPVIAAPPSLGYRAQKYIRKHRGTVIAASAVVAALVLGIIGTGTMTIQYRSAKAKADARADSEAKARESAELESYVANISASQSALASDRYEEARERLAACAEKLRGWEWKFLHRRAENVMGTIPPAHELVGFTPDGSRMAVLDDDIVYWRDLSGQVIGESMVTQMGQEWSQVWAKLSSDGSRITTASADGVIGLWDRSGRPIHPLVATDLHMRAHFTFSPDGSKLVAQCDDDTVSIWDANGNRLGGPTKVPGSARHVPEFTNDGNRVITHSEFSEVVGVFSQLWDLSMTPISPPIRDAEFNREGSRVLAYHEGFVQLMNAEGTEIAKLTLDSEKWQAPEFNVDGTLVLTQSERVGCVWDREGRLIGEPMKFGHIGQLEFSPDGKRIVSQDEVSGKIQIWDDHARHVADLDRNQHYFWFSPDGQRIVTSNKCIRIWDADGHPVCEPFPNPCDDGHEPSIEISPDNSLLLVFDSDDSGGAYRMWLYDLSGRSLGAWFDGSSFQDASWYLSVSPMERMFTPRGKHVVIQRKDAPWLIVSVDNFSQPIEYLENDPVQKWMIDSEGILVSTKRGHSVGSPGRFKPRITETGDIELADASPDNAVRIDGRHRGIGQVIADSRGKQVVTAGEESEPSLRFWDVASNREVATFSVFALAWDEMKIAASGGESLASRGVRMIPSGAGSIEFAEEDQQLVLTAYGPRIEWQAQTWDIRDAAARQHDRDAQRQELLARKDWAKRHLQELLSRQRAAKPVKKGVVDPWRDFLISDSGDPSVLAKVVLEQDVSLSPIERAAIFDAICEQLDELEATKLAVWEVVGRPDSTAEQVQHALEQAREPCETIPSEGNLQNLAVAQYRAGMFRDAMETFRHREALFEDYQDDDSFVGHAFQAMATYRADDQDTARRIMQHVEQLAKERKLDDGANEAGILQEARALIGFPTDAAENAPIPKNEDLQVTPTRSVPDTKRVSE